MKTSALGIAVVWVWICLGLLMPAMPASGAARNLVPHNAGFEVGTGGWRWYSANFAVASPGSSPENRRWKVVKPELVTNDAAKGHSSVRLTSTLVPGYLKSRFESFPVRLQPGTKYTLSAWLKSTKGPAQVTLAMNASEWTEGINTEEGTAVKEFKVTGEWQRLSLSFTPKTTEGHIAVFVRTGSILLDGVQLEQGELTDFTPVSSIEVDGAVNHPFGLLEAGQAAQATVKICIHGGSERTINLDWQIEDYALRVVKSSQKTLKVKPEEALVLTIPIDSTLKGGFRLVLKATDAATGDSDFFPLVYAVIPPPVKDVDPNKSPFGTTGFIWGGIGGYRVGFGYASYDEYLELMRRCGIHHTREEGMGGGIFGGIACMTNKPDPAKIDWYDEYRNDLLQNGIIPLPYVTPAVKWANTSEPFSPQSPFSIPQEEGMRWQAELIAAHNKGKIPVYETFWETQAWCSPENVAKVSRWIVEGLKKGDPACKVWGICPLIETGWVDPAKMDDTWLGRTLSLSKGIFDGFTVHLYYAGGCPDNPERNYPSFRAIVSGMNRLLEKNGIPARSFDTENGFDGASMYSPYIPGDLARARNKTEYTVRRMVIGLSLGVERWYYFTFQQGFFGWNMMPDPMVGSWTQMAQRLEGATFKEWLDQGPVQVYLFEGRDKRPLAVYWHLDTQDGATLEVNLKPDDMLVEDIMGNPVKVSGGADQKKTSLPLSTAAGYVMHQQGTLAELKAGFEGATAANVKPAIKLEALFGENVPPEIVATATAFNTVMERLKGAEVAGSVSPCPSVKGTVFKLKNGRPMVMAWLNLAVDNVEIGLALDPKKIEVLDVYGKPLRKGKLVKAGLETYPLGTVPLTIEGREIGLAELKQAVDNAEIYGLTLMKPGRISLAALGEKRMPNLVVPVMNIGAQSFSGVLKLSGMPASWKVNAQTSFGPIEKGKEVLAGIPIEAMPEPAYRVPVSGEVDRDDGKGVKLDTRKISVVFCPRASSAISVDGTINDTEWADATWLMLDKEENIVMGRKYWEGPPDSSMKAGLLWDDKGIYFAFKVKDDLLKRDVSLPFYQQDCVELWFDAAPDRNLYDQVRHDSDQGQIQFVPKTEKQSEDKATTAGVLASLLDLAASELASRKTEDGWEMEVKIPCAQADLAGRIIAFDIGLDDMDSAGGRLQMIWAGDGNTFKDPTQWGFMILRK